MSATPGLLDQYRGIVGDEFVDSLYRLARPLAKKRVLHVNATKSGGGVAEILHRLSPMMEELELEVDWQVIDGTPAFYGVTKKFHNALHGVSVPFSDQEFGIFEEVQAENQRSMELDADFVFIHDPQPIGLIDVRKRQNWIWRCHIDVESAHATLWHFLRRYIDRYDAAMFHLAQYARPVDPPSFLIPPAIDALSPKNERLEDEEIDGILDRLGIPRDLPYMVQVSRFDRLKDPVGVLAAWKIVNARVPCRLVLLGGAADDDPEGAEVLAEVREAAAGEDRVVILDLPPTSHREVNAVQRAATIVVQKSLREGFGLVVTEGMWKGKPMVGGAVGGIRHQIRHGTSGLLAATVEGAALQMLELLGNRAMRERLGAMARESVRASYLLPSLLRNYLLVMRSVARAKGEA